MKTCLLAVLSAMLVACAATTAKIEPARLDALKKGQTTADEVVRQFGRPSFISRNPDGTQTSTYYFSSEPGSGEIVTLIATTPKDSTTFYFDTKGVLTDYKVTEAPKAATPAAPQPGSTAASKPAGAKSPSVQPASAPTATAPVAAPAPAAAPVARKPAPVYNDRFPGSTTENR